jgi:glycosyltransferase involved in cell wall biosynthesis
MPSAAIFLKRFTISMSIECLVSVRLMTYNHEEFITDAMNGIMMQDVDFHVEVVVGDDFSSDRTLELIRCYQDTEFIHIRILDRSIGDSYWTKRQELGRLYNFINIIENCKGRYIALLDGDDYWSDPLKLKKQVAFLESNDDCILCHHWQVISEKTDDGIYAIKKAPTRGHGYYPSPKASVQKVFANELRIKTRSLLFRNFVIQIPDWFYNVPFGDVPLSMILGKHGQFGFLDEEMAVYRVTDGGVSRKGHDKPMFIFNHFLAWVRIWELGNNYYNGQYFNETKHAILHFYSIILRRYNFDSLIFSKTLQYALSKSELSLSQRAAVAIKLTKSFAAKKVKRLIEKL